MDEAIERIIARAASGEQFATITADDAYRDNLTEALPVFEKHGAPFTIYVAPATDQRHRRPVVGSGRGHRRRAYSVYAADLGRRT